MDQDNDLWEIEEGVPQLHDPFIQQFLTGRRSLIRREKSQRHDSNLRNALPPVAVRASNIVSQIRTQELRRLCSSAEIEQDDLPSDGLILHPSLMCGRHRAELENSDLWKIMRRLPKGSLLHGHLPAMVDTDFLIDLALTTPGIHISAPSPLVTQYDFQHATFAFQYSSRPVEESKDKPTLWSDDYQSSALVNLQTAATLFPDGGETGFRNWLKSRCTVTSEHPRSARRPSAISDLFNRHLPVINSLLHYEPILRACLHRILLQLATDGIKYVEFRLAFDFQYTLEARERPEQDYSGWIRIFHEEVERFKSSEEGQGFHGARIIWATMRNLSNKEIGESMKQCVIMKKKYTDLICGFDLLGEETQQRPLHDLLPILFWFRGRCAEEGLDIPFIFHAGQSLGDGDKADGNLFDAVLLSSRRISQGLSLYKHPLLIDVVRSKQILVECSPTSSQGFGLTSCFQAHPIPALLSREVSVVLCNDSPGIFGYKENGLSSEFWQALLAFKNMGLTDLAMMVENSIRWSCYEDQTSSEWTFDVREGILGEGVKATRLQNFYAEFDNFCQWLVQEYGERYPETPGSLSS